MREINEQETKIKNPKKCKNLLINIIVLIIAVIIFFSVFEIILRLTEPKPKYQRDNEFIFYEYDELLGWKNKANSNGTFYIPDSVSYVQINSKGLRDIEHDYNKKKGVKRIEFYGDSFTWSYGINESERYTSVLRKKLNETYPGKYEIINLAVTGYGTDQQYLFFKTEGIKYKPDIIVFAFHNDAGDVARKEAYSYPKPFFVLEDKSLKLTNVPVPKRETNWTEKPALNKAEENLIRQMDIKLRFFRSYEFFRKRILYLSIFRKWKDSMAGVDKDKTLEVINSLLLESKNLSKRNNASFIVLILPDKSQIYGNTDVSEIKNVVNFCESNNITLIDLSSDLKEANNKNFYFEIDGHLSEEGNKFVGEILFDKLVERGLI